MKLSLLYAFAICYGCLVATAAPSKAHNNVVKVNQHGDGNGHFHTIGDALKSLPDNSDTYVIEIESGVYEEQLVIDRSGPVVLRGNTKNGQRSSYKDNAVTIAWNSTATNGVSDEDSSVVLVKNDGFRAYNINFNQTYGLSFSGPQSVAVTVDGDKAVFDQCLFTSYQDTLFVGNRSWTGRQYFKESYIAGAVDFIFGNASSYFDRCIIASNGPGHISAQKRQYHDENEAVPSAMIFNECQIITDPNTNGVDLTQKVDLGRPWRKYAKVVYMNSYIGDHIKPKGWGDWYSSTLGDYSNVEYYEYNNTGPGSWQENMDARAEVNYTRLINDEEAKEYTLDAWFHSDLSWLN